MPILTKFLIGGLGLIILAAFGFVMMDHGKNDFLSILGSISHKESQGFKSSNTSRADDRMTARNPREPNAKTRVDATSNPPSESLSSEWTSKNSAPNRPKSINSKNGVSAVGDDKARGGGAGKGDAEPMTSGIGNAANSSGSGGAPPLLQSTPPGVVDIPMAAGVPIREISIPVPEGAKVPALFLDDAPKPEPQMRALNKIAAEFEKNVSEIPPGMTKEEVWESAREFADESYIMLFGYQAYNQYHIQAAKEALREKRARANPAGP